MHIAALNGHPETAMVTLLVSMITILICLQDIVQKGSSTVDAE